MDVKRFAEADAIHWDHFVRQHEDGSFFHLTGWKQVIERTFGYQSSYLSLEDRGQLVAVLPLFKVKSPLCRVAFTSVPFGVYGGILASSSSAYSELMAKAKALAEEQRAAYVEFKNIRKRDEDLPTKDLYVTFIQDLDPDPAINFELIPRKTRRMVRVSLRNELEAEFTREGIDEFYEIYAHSLHWLGTPVFPKRLFQNILQTFPECFFLFVRHRGRRIAGVLTLVYGGSLLPYYGGSYREYNHLGANNFMYWKLIEHGCQTGYKRFDFGRSKKNAGSGSYDYKRHWGMQEISLEYQYYLSPGEHLPNVSPANPKFKLLVETWKRLPFPLTKILGPRLVRYFP
ncbi:MAG: FemAB family PEP-CTERM system-associated protein [Acidobacteria bacterium]|nr:FemAB family PEP-CTERM system-associated protein [Acidobacteriota bacterium]MBI3655282.1 FemAB family PEP-CTERM system-associated protein [Acidobacteriota bacterium]